MTKNESLTLICIQLCLSIISGNRKEKKDSSNLYKANTFKDELGIIQKENKVKISIKQSKLKRIDKVKTPSILFDIQGAPFILAKANKDKCLIQRPNKEAPEIITYNQLDSIWNKKWIEIKQSQSRFDITWFIPEFLQHKKVLWEILLFSFVLQILALISPLFFKL